MWFVTPKTAMNPNLDDAAIIPGLRNASSGGIIATSGHAWTCRLTDSIALLKSTGALTDELSKSLDNWNEQYLRWLTTSTNGFKDAGGKQNHASWHVVETAALAFSVGNVANATAQVARLTNSGVKPALGHQIEPSGVMPYEAVRTDGASYSCFNMAALFNAATIGHNLKPAVSPDLFTYVNATGGGSGSIRNALDYLLTFATNTSKPWPFTQQTKTADAASAADAGCGQRV
jgi:hypothetical protein